MSSTARRRWRNGTVAVIAVVLLLAVHWVLTATLGASAHPSGWLLLTVCVVLAAYNVRKKLPFLPLVASAAWLQLHIYVGLVSVVVFAAHVGFAWPNGGLETTLFVLYLAVAATGAAGLVLTRMLPPRLNARGENIIFERIPVVRRALREQAETLVLESVGTSKVAVLGDLYHERLQGFFSAPRHFWSHLLGSSRPRHVLLSEIDALRRYVREDDREHLSRLAELVRLKDDLDYRHMAYAVLKGWLFAHIPLTWMLIIVAIVHVAVVHAFSGVGS